MSLEAARNLPMQDLLDLLSEKFKLECTWLREAHLPLAPLVPEIGSLEANIHGAHQLVGSFRNLLRPVNSLPRVILSQIIRHVPHEQDTDARAFVVLTHVCRYWREFIVSTPWNWTLISSSRSMDLAASSIQRAKATPLEICLDMDQVRENPGFCDLINSSIQNAKSLRFSGFITVKELTGTLPSFLQSTPNLRSLTLDGAKSRGNSGDPFESLPPTLRYLNLSCFPLYPPFLRLRTLTELTLYNDRFGLHLDTLLDFLEENRSLESVTLGIMFAKPSLRHSRRGTAIANQFQHLLIFDGDDGKSLISNITLRRGAHLVIYSKSSGELNDILSGTSTVHLSNLLSPTFMEYQSDSYGERNIRLLGPNGSLSFQKSCPYHNALFKEFSVLPLTNIREFRFLSKKLEKWTSLQGFNISFFPALETLAIHCETRVSDLPTLFSNPSFPPSLKTFAFSNCHLSGDFMEKLTRFASNRKNTTSALLRRVLIVDSREALPSVGEMDALGKHVPVVDVRIGKELPTDLT